MDQIRESVIDRPASVVENLIHNDSGEPRPRGFSEDDDDQRGGSRIVNGLERHRPDEESLEEYRRLYEETPPVQEMIDGFADAVMEPGWWIEADDDETAKKLTKYMNNVAVVGGNSGQNFSELATQLVIEREVRGTAFVEKARDADGEHAGLYPLQSETISIYTIPGKAILPSPDMTFSDDAKVIGPDEEARVGADIDGKITEDGEVAAYVQFDNQKPVFVDKEEIRFTKDQVIKWERSMDIGDVRGTSRIKAIAERLQGLLDKIQANDDAIMTKAWPIILFSMGSEDAPWTEEEVEEFMQHYEGENLEPGLMQAVSGDVSIEEFAGETADLEQPLGFDVDWIISGLPGPKYATGGFSQQVTQAVAQAQEREYQRQVKKTRRSLEDKFTPYLRDVAEEHDELDPEGVKLHVARPKGEDIPPEAISGSIIRYTSDAGDDGDGADGGEGEQGSREDPLDPGEQAEDRGHTVATAELESSEELADPRLVSTAEQQNKLEDLIQDVLLTAREDAIERISPRFDDAPVVASESFESVANRAVTKVMNESNIASQAEPLLLSVVDDTLSTLGQETHTPTFENTGIGVRHRQDARSYANNVREQTKQALDEMLDDMKTEIRHSAQKGASAEEMRERIEMSIGEGELKSRAQIIAHMETNHAVNATKLSEYDRHPDVVGVKVINSCGDDTTPLCKDLAGCAGEQPAEATFDADNTVSEQLSDQTNNAHLFDGFEPLPPAPPFHFGCTSEIVPVTEQ